ncbi:MAG: DUF3604 domain-containing protein [Motiliproteus sp.]
MNRVNSSISNAAVCALTLVVAANSAVAEIAATGVVQNTAQTVLQPQSTDPQVKAPVYSPYAGRNFPTQVLWGDTHLHTNLSLDARAGGVTLGPEAAYRFARGEEVTSSHGERVKLLRPLDFLVVSDHSDAMGGMDQIFKGNPVLLKDPTINSWYQKLMQGGAVAKGAVVEVVQAFTTGKAPKIMLAPDFARPVWEQYLDTAEQFNDPGRFTALIGYEWTSTTGGNNLHRNVLYRDGADKARQALPFTVADSDNPEDLWNWMAGYEDQTQGQVIALAHNGNLSNGLMFPEVNPATGKPLTRDYAINRIRWEPLYEVTQIKGDGEAHSMLSPDDEFADYGTWDWSNLGPVKKQPQMLQYEYGRQALKLGLKLEQTLGINPYKFGMIGSTDAHTGLATAEEGSFFGKISYTEPNANRANSALAVFGDVTWMNWSQVASGYAAVWAKENTREAIFDAMKRKEVYATTGPRMTVWFFGGWDFQANDALQRTPGAIGYSKGVSMGGDLSQAPAGKSPSFLVTALKDPYGGNLDRVQIVKGWLDAQGEMREQVYDVVWSDQRKPGADGKLPAVGNTVDQANATWTNDIGASELMTTWQDPDFNADQSAFYYARVLEIPTPHWTAYDAKRFGLVLKEGAPKSNQERAYTSPIWYTPEK